MPCITECVVVSLGSITVGGDPITQDRGDNGFLLYTGGDYILYRLQREKFVKVVGVSYNTPMASRDKEGCITEIWRDDLPMIQILKTGEITL
jgi:hypothetical protein